MFFNKFYTLYGNANFAWVEHMVSKLSMNGKAAIILANGSLSAGGQEEEIRKNLIEADLVESAFKSLCKSL